MNHACLFQHFVAGLKTRVLISLIVGEQLSSQLTILHKIVSHVGSLKAADPQLFVSL